MAHRGEVFSKQALAREAEVIWKTVWQKLPLASKN